VSNVLDYLEQPATVDQPQATATDGVDLYTINDVLAYQTPPDHKLAGDGIIRRGACCLLAAGTGVGKSVMAEQVAVSVSAGLPILGCIPVHGKFRVLYIGAENDPETLQRDNAAIIEHTGANLETVNANMLIAHVYALSGAAFTDWLELTTAEHKPDLIVIDPYQSFCGAQDINGTQGFLEWVGPVQSTIQTHSAALLLVAHTPKPRERDSWNPLESVYMAAGTSAIANWARTSIELCTLKSATDRFLLRFGKNAQRNGLTDDHGGIVREVYVQHSGNMAKPFWRIADDQQRDTASKHDDAIRKHLETEPKASNRGVAAAIGCDHSTVSRRKRALGL
jgi:hypothetical protein